jgi:Flp pilus assembly protein CpaB
MAEREVLVAGTADPNGARGHAAGRPGSRLVRRRRPLPGGRAVAGGFLVAVAAVGIFAAYTSATTDARKPYVVARHDLALGEHLTTSDLSFALMQLPPPLAHGRAFTRGEAGRLVGAVVVAPVSAGELIQASNVAEASGVPPGQEISFLIDPARAVGGRLRSGEAVDVLATYGTGNDAYTVVVVRGTRVVATTEPGGTLTGRAGEVITLSLSSSSDALAVAHAADAGQVTLVRATGAPPPNDAGVYRTPASRDPGR